MMGCNVEITMLDGDRISGKAAEESIRNFVEQYETGQKPMLWLRLLLSDEVISRAAVASVNVVWTRQEEAEEGKRYSRSLTVVYAAPGSDKRHEVTITP